ILQKQQVRHQARVAAVAVSEGMNLRHAMMESCRNVVERHGFLLDLPGHVVEQLLELDANVSGIDADAGLLRPDLSGPFPGLAKHTAVQGLCKLGCQEVPAFSR